MPFYVADYLADTGHLGPAEHGAYLLLIMHYWQKGALPDDDRQLARIVRMTDKAWAAARLLIAPFFAEGWRHARIELELAKADDKAKRRADAGQKGGFAKHTSSKPPSNARVLPAENPSKTLASSSQPEPEEDKHSLRSCSSSVADDSSPLEVSEKPKRKRPDDEDLIQDLAAIWNREATSMGLPRIENLSDKRLSIIRARIKEFSDFGFDDPRAGFVALMGRIRGSPFLLGQTGSRNWRATFDFAISPSGFTKILEGTYETQGKVVSFGRH